MAEKSKNLPINFLFPANSMTNQVLLIAYSRKETVHCPVLFSSSYCFVVSLHCTYVIISSSFL